MMDLAVVDMEAELLLRQKEDDDASRPSTAHHHPHAARVSGTGTGLLIALSTLGALSFVERFPHDALYKQMCLLVWACLIAVAVCAIVSNLPVRPHKDNDAMGSIKNAERDFGLWCLASLVTTGAVLSISMNTAQDLKESLTILSFSSGVMGLLFAKLLRVGE